MKLLYYIYTIWAGVTFALFALVGVVFFFFCDKLLGKKAIKYQLLYNKFWVKSWGFLTGVRFEVINQTKISEHQPYVFVSNHLSFGDALVINIAIKNLFSPLAKIEIKSWPVLGYLFGQVSVFVNRNDPDSRRKSVEQMTERIKQNISLMVFAEGTRNKREDIPLKQFYSGAFRIAIDTQLPIAPIVLVNSNGILPNEKLPARPAKIIAVYADPIPTEGLTQDDLPALKAQTHAVMEQLVLQHNPRFKGYIKAEDAESN